MSIARHDIHHGYRVVPQSTRAPDTPLHECLMPQLDQHLRAGMKQHWVDAAESDGDAKVKAKAGAARPGLGRHEAPKHRASGHPSPKAPSPPVQAAHQARQDHRAEAPRTNRPTAAPTSSAHAPSATAATRAPQAVAAAAPAVVSKVAQATAATTPPAKAPAPSAAPSAAATTAPTPSRSTATSLQEPASPVVTSGINTEVLDKAVAYSKEAAGLGGGSAEDLMQLIRDMAEKELRFQSEMGVMQLATKMNEAVAKTIKTTGESIKGVAG